MTFMWPQLLLLLLLVPLGVVFACAPDRASARRGAGGRAARGRPSGAAGAPPAGDAAARPGRPLLVAGFVVLGDRRSPGRRRTSRCRGTRARSSSTSTCRGAWPRRPRSRPAWTPAKTAADHRRAPAAGRRHRARRVQRRGHRGPGARPATRRTSSPRSSGSRPPAGRRSGRASCRRSTRSRRPRTTRRADVYSNRSGAPRDAAAGGRRRATRRRSSSCSPTARTTSVPTRWRPPRTPPTAGIRIFTIGIGSAAGADLDLDGFKVHTQLDEATLTRSPR